MRISYGIDVFQRVDIETAHLILHRKQYDVKKTIKPFVLYTTEYESVGK